MPAKDRWIKIEETDEYITYRDIVRSTKKHEFTKTHYKNSTRSFSPTNSIAIHKNTLKILNPREAVFLSFLLQNTIIELEEWFTCTQEYIEESIGYTYEQRKTAIKNLQNKNLLITKKEGKPYQTWFRLNSMEINKITENAYESQLYG